MAKEKDRVPADDLSTEAGTNELISYLVVRFIVVLLAVLFVEQLMVWAESLVLPPLRAALEGSDVPVRWADVSVFSLAAQLAALLVAVVRGTYLPSLGLVWNSLAAVLLLAMLLSLVLPPFLGAMGFARLVVRRLRRVQEERERQLVQLDQQRSQFITDIAHDLRTPLMAISGMAHAVADGVVRDEDMRNEYLRSIRDKADKLGSLVSSVFDYTKLGSGAFELERERIDLPQLLLREAAVAYSDIEDAGMTLSVEVSEEPCDVFADPVQLGRVVANLLTNAARHNEPGTEVALLLVRQAGIAYVVVADTGQPITGNSEDLFQPFSRGDAARSNTGGSGLGLSICRRIADLHGYGLALVQPYGRFSKAFVLRCTVL